MAYQLPLEGIDIPVKLARHVHAKEQDAKVYEDNKCKTEPCKEL